MTTVAIIVAAGRGTRAGGGVPKQWRPLAGKPLLAHGLEAFREAPGVDRVMLVLHPEDMALAEGLAGPEVALVAGGATRDASVRAALEALAGTGATQVLIHDGARPLVSGALIARLLEALGRGPAAAPALAVTDALVARR